MKQSVILIFLGVCLASATFSHGHLLSKFEKDEPPCCFNCTEGTEKYFSVVTKNGYCAESCIDPKKFSEYHLFEKNLTKADTNEACASQFSADGQQYTKYVYTETHSVPGMLICTRLSLMCFVCSNGFFIQLSPNVVVPSSSHLIVLRSSVSFLLTTGLKVSVDFYAQTNAPDHKCCYTDGSLLLCAGKPEHLTVDGVKYCCPKGATVDNPCPSA